ncbi:MAG: HAMP domain-containing sensor histidine kinase [Sulfurimonas sp.]|nr:HAMP domain-containing sensor histidine kinase [Sulfurimonas sp.]
MDDENERSFYASITSMIALQLDRIRLINKTMAASKAKSAFISNMSHELRTPLNAIIGSAQFLIAYEELSDAQQDSVGSIESSAEYLLNMINEILDIAKIEAGKMEVYKEKINILETLNNCYYMLQPLADEKGLDFELNSQNLTIFEIQTDPKIFQQITINLLSNAIKFTKEGFVKLTIYNDKKYLYIEIEDSGIGISKLDMLELFNDFTQVKNVMRKQHKGTGLGLSLSQKLAHILDGDVELFSAGLGYGCRATFSLYI